jgi:hypothetical protein
MNKKKIAFFFVGFLLVILYTAINPSEVDFLPKCPFYYFTGFYCAGCGSQRATHQLLNFNFFEVLNQNLLFVIGLLIIAYHLTVEGINHFFKKNIYNYIYHPKTPIIILIIVILFWILRNIPIYPFNLLAPK